MVGVDVNVLLYFYCVFEVNQIGLGLALLQSDVYFLLFGQLHDGIRSQNAETALFFFVLQINNANQYHTVGPASLEGAFTYAEMVDRAVLGMLGHLLWL